MHVVIYMFPYYSLNSSHLLLPPLCPQVWSLCHLTWVRMAIIKKNLQTINAGVGVEKTEPSYTVCENVHWNTQLTFLLLMLCTLFLINCTFYLINYLTSWFFLFVFFQSFQLKTNSSVILHNLSGLWEISWNSYLLWSWSDVLLQEYSYTVYMFLVILVIELDLMWTQFISFLRVHWQLSPW